MSAAWPSGADSAAHKGALDEGGKNHCRSWLRSGYLLSQKQWRTDGTNRKNRAGTLRVSSRNPSGELFGFPLRNRIISGLSRGGRYCRGRARKRVAQSRRKKAAEQGREVFAVPGNINCIYSIGAGNKLIQDGANPARCA